MPSMLEAVREYIYDTLQAGQWYDGIRRGLSADWSEETIDIEFNGRLYELRIKEY